MELISPYCWDATTSDPHHHYLTNLFTGGSLSTTNSELLLQFLCCWETDSLNYYRTFGLGYYKFTAYINGNEKDFFYFDYRTSAVPEDYNNGGSGDLQIDFDVYEEKFFNTATQIEFPAYSSIWEQKPWIHAETHELEDFWDHSLFIIPYANQHPYIVWGPYPSEGKIFSVSGYKIYRAIETFADPEYANFSYLTSVSANQYNYIDEQYDVGSGWYGFYKITAVDQSTESDFSNIAITGINAFNKEKVANTQDNFDSQNFLSQNYPNPFNPSTIIEYKLSEKNYTSLTAYDILGREVSTLVNEIQDAGYHSVEFDGKNLPSGIYIYKLQSGNFLRLKKMILQK